MENTRISFLDLLDKRKTEELLNLHKKLDVFDDDIYQYTIYVKEDDMLEVNELLKKIGKSLFVEYFNVFKSRSDAYKYLPIKYSSSSRRLRTTYALQIFAKGLEVDALQVIVNSNRVDIKTKEKANKILNELGITTDYKNDIRYIVKNLIPTLIQEGVLDAFIERFLQKDFSKDMFGIQYPLLKRVDMFYDIDTLKRDEMDYVRYYEDIISYNESDYLLCSHWENKRHLKKMNQFILNLELDEEKYGKYLSEEIKKARQ